MCQMLQIEILNYFATLAEANKPELALKAYVELREFIKIVWFRRIQRKDNPSQHENCVYWDVV